MKYSIYEGNWDTFNKKVERIRKKSEKYDCDFSYEVLGEHFENLSDEYGDFVGKFYDIEISGTAKISNGWELIGRIDHNPDGNIIKVMNIYNQVNIPARFYTSRAVCEHCNTRRNRKTTCLVYNRDTEEWKQVGTTCLKDYTGLDAEIVAMFSSFIDNAENSRYTGKRHEVYYPLKEVLVLSSKCIEGRGYHKWDSYGEMSTKEEVYRELIHTASVNIPEDSKYHKEANEALEWVRSTTEDNNYLNNLRSIANSEYVKDVNLGIAVSIIQAYHNHLERKAKKSQNIDESNSKFVGKTGDKISIDVKVAMTVTGWEGIYGYTWLYKFLDKDGNVYVWYSSKGLYLSEKMVTKLSGTVKNHTTYNGVNQTVLTRCRVLEEVDRKEV